MIFVPISFLGSEAVAKIPNSEFISSAEKWLTFAFWGKNERGIIIDKTSNFIVSSSIPVWNLICLNEIHRADCKQNYKKIQGI